MTVLNNHEDVAAFLKDMWALVKLHGKRMQIVPMLGVIELISGDLKRNARAQSGPSYRQKMSTLLNDSEFIDALKENFDLIQERIGMTGEDAEKEAKEIHDGWHNEQS